MTITNPYEIVFTQKGAKPEAVSPETCTYDEAERTLNEVRPKIGTEDTLPVDWYAGTGESITAAYIRRAEAHRSREQRSVADILAAANQIG